MPIPTPLVNPLRAALVSQGFPASSLTDAGEINPAALIGGVINSVEVRTALTPPVTIRLADIQLGGPANPYASFLKPTFKITTQAGVTTLAPYGEAGDGTLGGVLLLAGLIGLGVLIGRATA